MWNLLRFLPVGALLSCAMVLSAQTTVTISEYPIPTAGSGSITITPGPDGALWFGEYSGNKIGRISAAGVITEYSVSTVNSYPVGITLGPDGALWFTEEHGNKIGRITTAGVITEYPVPTAYSYPEEIALGPDGALWFAEMQGGGKIGRITTAGVITEYPTPTANSGTAGITAGPDGALWFTEGAGNKIGRITSAGIITEYAVPTAGSNPSVITAGPDGALWFTENSANKIGRAAISGGTACSYSLSASSASPGAAQTTGTVTVTASSASCTWMATSNVPSWITITNGASGAGTGTVTYSVAANSGTSSRTGTLTIAGQTFTVTQAGTAQSTSIAITNPGFETLPANPNWTPCAGAVGSGGAGCRDTADGNIPGWTASGGGSMGLFQPGSIEFTLPLPATEGQTIGYVNSGTLSQTLSVPLQASTLYTLQVDVGMRLDCCSSPPTVQLLAGGTVIATATGAKPALGGWTTWTGTYQSSAADPLAGRALKIVLAATAPQGDFDNVRLTSAPAGTVTQMTYNGFASTAGLTMVGSAATTTTGDGLVLRLTPASGGQSGAAYSTTPVRLGTNASFNTQFQFRFTNPGGIDPADGITFVLATSTTGLGTSGMGMGYQGASSNSVAIEFDTYNNGGDGLDNNDGNSSNHVAIDTGGMLTNTDLHNVYSNGSCGFANGTPAQNPNTAAGCMSNGDLWTANIGYDGSNLTVILTDPAETGSSFAIDSYPINIASILGQNSAFVGFTSGTGGGWENHDIVNWTFTSNAPPCSYSVSPLTQNQPGSVVSGSVTGLIQVSTSSGCAWTATSNSSWITVESGTPGTASGVVSYQASANTTGAARTGTLTVAGLTVVVNQAAAAATGPACAYSISPSSNSAPAIGGGSSVLLSANPNSCPWSIAVDPSASTWLHVTSPTSGTGSLSVNYTVDQNTGTTPRTGTIALAGQTFTVTQAGGASATAPNISPGGIVNAANNRGAGIAQGSFFTIYGSNLGPASYVQATTYPIPTSLGSVTVTAAQGSTSKQAYLTFVSAGQINAILPSTTPLGSVQITVTYNGVASAPATINVVSTAFGIFSTAGGRGPGIVQNYISGSDQPLNTITIAAKPQQIGIIWGTGLGAITTGDNTAPPGGNMGNIPVQVLVAGQPVTPLYAGRAPNFAGVDNVYFNVPSGVPLGCYVPVQVIAAGTWSNTVTIAVSADGSHCKDTSNPLSGISSTGGNLGVLGLMRLNYYGQLDPSQPATNSIVDLGIGDFAKVTAGGDMAQSPFMNLPPVGACKSTNRSLDLGAAMGSGGSSLDPSLSKMLDAGASLAVTGPAGTQTISQVDTNSPYLAVLGGSVSAGSSVSVGNSQSAPFLVTGPFTIAGTGGADVGAFSVTVSEPPAVNWTNEMQITAINRTTPLTLTWTGGDPTATMVIVGASSDPNTQASGGFTCMAAVSAGTFTVPVSTLADLVVVNPSAPVSGDQSSQLGVLGMMPLPMANTQKFTATGLNAGYVFATTMTLESVQVK